MPTNDVFITIFYFTLKILVHPLQKKTFQFKFGVPLFSSHWGETAGVHTLQLFSPVGCKSEQAHFATHWGKIAPLSAMRALILWQI